MQLRPRQLTSSSILLGNDRFPWLYGHWFSVIIDDDSIRCLCCCSRRRGCVTSSVTFMGKCLLCPWVTWPPAWLTPVVMTVDHGVIYYNWPRNSCQNGRITKVSSQTHRVSSWSGISRFILRIRLPNLVCWFLVLMLIVPIWLFLLGVVFRCRSDVVVMSLRLCLVSYCI